MYIFLSIGHACNLDDIHEDFETGPMGKGRREQRHKNTIVSTRAKEFDIRRNNVMRTPNETSKQRDT